MTQTSPAASASSGGQIVLARDPFSAWAAAPYTDAHTQRLLVQLNLLIDKTELIALVSGPAGSGKSVLRRLFADQAPAHFVLLEVDAATSLRGVDLLAEVVERFGSRRRKSDDLQDLFTGHYGRGKQPVLVVDAAERLDDRALHLIARLAEHGLHLVLFARHDAEGRLARELDPERIQLLRVPALDVKRSFCYLRHRFAAVGYQGPMPFDGRALAEIQRQSGGLPGEINRVARAHLSDNPPQPAPASAPSRGESVAGPLLVAFGVVLAIVMGLGVVWWWTQRDKGGGLPDDLDALLGAPAGYAVSSGAASRAGSPVGEPEPEADAAVPPDEDDAAVEPIAVRELPRDATPAVPVPAVSRDSRVEEPPLDEAGSVADALSAVAAEGAPMEVLDPEPEEVVPPVSAGGPQQPANAEVLARNPRHYTMQLVAGRSLGAIHRFIDQYEVGADSLIYQLDRDGKPYYALVYRDYATKAEALAALDALPDELKAKQPWLRRFSAIQSTLGEE